MVHHLVTRFEVARPLDQVFAFFAEAANLERITPPELSFRILTPGPIVIRAGTLIDYQLRLFGVPVAWKTEITAWTPPYSFVDRQLKGPYRVWIHTHRFETTPNGTAISDQVQYELPMPPVGDLVLPVVRLQLARIFAFREQAVRRLLA
ncbi:MAG: SRPBCC family protein [Acidobacteria bacterium]|nr:SRPBCC family protein [Acidobacteriota bacterium]